MKSKTKIRTLWVSLILLIIVVGYMLVYPRMVEVGVPVEVPVIVPPVPPRRQRRFHQEREPEFRGPPVKEYKPGHTQQMGLLLGEGGMTLPLYGKEVRGRRDRYHYYTTTSGDNLYPIPVIVGDRDCVDDIGCQELYGNETVSVTGKTGSFEVKMYRTDDFF